MKNRSGEKIKLASIDELLGVVNEESAMEIEISKIHPFKNHPFKAKQYRSQYSIDLYTFYQVLHLFIIQHLERMILKRMDLTNFYLHC